MKKTFEGKTILVTGACGSVGSELIFQLLNDGQYKPNEVIGLDNNESQLFFLDQQYLDEDRARFYVLDIKDLDELTKKMMGVDIVFHCAALKHVILCERSPEQAIMTNIGGVKNVIAAAIDCGVEKVIFTSSDKAVNPTNVMGTSKLMGERLITAANSNTKGAGPIFSSTRFGNVMGSNGSVIPIFRNQIASGGKITLTHRDMTRFVMSIEESVKLVIDSAFLAKGGEVFITKMPVVRIEDLAKAMILELAPTYGRKPEDIEIVEVGMKPGEKLYEELMSLEETRRAVELENYFSVLPAFRGIYRNIDYSYPDILSDLVTNPYVSSVESSLSVAEIRGMLNDFGLINPKPKAKLTSRYWPGDK